MKVSFLPRHKTGIWLIDVQERLFPHVERACEVLERLRFVLKSARLLQLPCFVTEQQPDSLGGTLESLQNLLSSGITIYPKTTFSGYADPEIKKAIDRTSIEYWILTGIEAHICVLQTAKDLILAGKQVVVLNDAITSRSIYDYSTAIAEMKEMGVRISSAETVFYELLRDASSVDFKEFLQLVKQLSHG